MYRSARVVSLTLAVLLLLGVVGAGAAFAQTPTPGSGTNTATDWQSVFVGKLATILGVDQQQLTNAMQQAAKETRDQRIDEAVAAGRITQEYADWLKQRPDDGRLDLGLGRGFHGDKMGGRVGGGHGGVPWAQTTPTPAP
ncbi:MAG: hypothetical protein ACYC4L_07910 [Chloroflexota bacterium]